VVQVRSRRLSFLAAEHQQTYRFSLLLSPCPCLALESGQFENCKGVNDSPAASKRQRCLTRTGLSLLLVQRWRQLIPAYSGPTVSATGPLGATLVHN